MTERQREKEMDALKMDIANLREDIATLAASVRKIAEGRAREGVSDAEQEASTGERPTAGERWSTGWSDFQRRLEEARTRGEKVIGDLAVEIERHPLGSIAAAFGIGFLIPKLLDRGDNE